MRCRQVTRMISESHERSLDIQEKVGIKVHLVMCPHCRRFQQNCETLSEMMKQFRDAETSYRINR